MTKTIRAFIAIELSTSIKNELGRAGQELSRQVAPGSVKWVKPEQIHLTVRFLGETAVSLLPALFANLDKITAEHAPFTLQLANLGFFPSSKRPRVIWVGIAEPTSPLMALQQSIEQMVLAQGWPAEKPFHPHLTLGRVKEGQQVVGDRLRLGIKKEEMLITAVYLIQSDLRPTGPVYTTLHTSHLQK